MLIGSRSGFVTLADREEEMYKEMFLACVANLPQGKSVILSSDDITYIGPAFLSGRCWGLNSGNPGTPFSTGTISISFPNVTHCGVGSLGGCFNSCGLVSVDMPNLVTLSGGLNFQNYWGTEITLPKLTSCGNHDFSYSKTLKTLRLPSLTSRAGAFFCYECSALENVYLDSMTLSQFGGASAIANQVCNASAVFHLADGDYDYQGNPITSNSNGGGA